MKNPHVVTSFSVTVVGSVTVGGAGERPRTTSHLLPYRTRALLYARKPNWTPLTINPR